MPWGWEPGSYRFTSQVICLQNLWTTPNQRSRKLDRGPFPGCSRQERTKSPAHDRDSHKATSPHSRENWWRLRLHPGLHPVHPLESPSHETLVPPLNRPQSFPAATSHLTLFLFSLHTTAWPVLPFPTLCSLQLALPVPLGGRPLPGHSLLQPLCPIPCCGPSAAQAHPLNSGPPHPTAGHAPAQTHSQDRLPL